MIMMPDSLIRQGSCKTSKKLKKIEKRSKKNHEKIKSQIEPKQPDVPRIQQNT